MANRTRLHKLSVMIPSAVHLMKPFGAVALRSFRLVCGLETETALARSIFRHREARWRSFARGNYSAVGPRLNK